MIEDIFERYAELHGAPEAFRRASLTPLPAAGWHPSAWSVRTFDDQKPSRVPGIPIPWCPGAVRLPEPASDEVVISRMLGDLHMQEEAAMIAARLLQVKPGEAVLDACAAPGNKTAALALAAGPQGTVTAVDTSAGRLGVVRTTVDVLGLTNVQAWVGDAAGLPGDMGPFDAAMVDVPCSCEGTSRKHPGVLGGIPEEARADLAVRQEAILRAAIRKTRPGGRLVYATCTYAPEENERVVSAVLSAPEAGQDVRAVGVSIDGLDSAPGVAAWRGTTYHPDVVHAHRLWPHRTDTGGFFAVLLRKTGPATAEVVTSASHEDPPTESKLSGRPWTNYGLARLASTFASIERGAKYTSVISTGLTRLLRADTLFAGMTGLNLKSGDARLSTSCARRFGSVATRGVVDIHADHLKAYLRRASVPYLSFTPPEPHAAVLIVRANGRAVGLGRIRRKAPDVVESLFPKIWAGIEVGRTLGDPTGVATEGGSGT